MHSITLNHCKNIHMFVGLISVAFRLLITQIGRATAGRGSLTVAYDTWRADMIFLISCRQLFQMLSLEAGDLRLWWEENNQLFFFFVFQCWFTTFCFWWFSYLVLLPLSCRSEVICVWFTRNQSHCFDNGLAKNNKQTFVAASPTWEWSAFLLFYVVKWISSSERLYQAKQDM